MSVFRRRHTDGADFTPPTPAPAQSQQQQSLTPAPAQPAPTTALPPRAVMQVPPHIERALITLTGKMQQCVERLDVLEHRIDELAELVSNTPSHSDVLEVRLHSAKLAAELARTTVELRGEIGLASEEARRTLRASRNDTTSESVTLPVDVEIEKATTIDLTEQSAKDDEQRRPNNPSQRSA